MRKSGTTNNYEYNYLNQLERIKNGNTLAVSYEYDELGNQIKENQFSSNNSMTPFRVTSYSYDLKKYLGSPGDGKQWHHIVEQSQIKKSGFSVKQIQNTDNIIAIDKVTHGKISGYYLSKQVFTGGKTVRDWLAGQSYKTQYEFGINTLKKFGVIE